MANTYELIASNTVGVLGSASITFSSIAATWTDLVLVTSLRSLNTSIDPAFITFNGSSTGYSYKSIWSSGSGSPASYGSSSDTSLQFQYIPGATQTSNTFNNAQLYIPNYAGSNYKSVSIDPVEENNATTAYIVPMAGLWSNTAAITSITLTGANASFAQYSTAYLYGIKNS